MEWSFFQELGNLNLPKFWALHMACETPRLKNPKYSQGSQADVAPGSHDQTHTASILQFFLSGLADLAMKIQMIGHVEGSLFYPETMVFVQCVLSWINPKP